MKIHREILPKVAVEKPGFDFVELKKSCLNCTRCSGPCIAFLEVMTVPEAVLSRPHTTR